MSEERETRKEPRRINIFYEIENRFFSPYTVEVILTYAMCNEKCKRNVHC